MCKAKNNKCVKLFIVTTINTLFWCWSTLQFLFTSCLGCVLSSLYTQCNGLITVGTIENKGKFHIYMEHPIVALRWPNGNGAQLVILRCWVRILLAVGF